jgi:hypothetical protein
MVVTLLTSLVVENIHTPVVNCHVKHERIASHERTCSNKHASQLPGPCTIGSTGTPANIIKTG